MNAEQHTPGPWTLEANPVNIWVYGPGGEVIATLPNTPQGQANARLVVLGPELVSLLCANLDAWGNFDVLQDEHEALIANIAQMLKRVTGISR